MPVRRLRRDPGGSRALAEAYRGGRASRPMIGGDRCRGRGGHQRLHLDLPVSACPGQARGRHRRLARSVHSRLEDVEMAAGRHILTSGFAAVRRPMTVVGEGRATLVGDRSSDCERCSATVSAAKSLRKLRGWWTGQGATACPGLSGTPKGHAARRGPRTGDRAGGADGEAGWVGADMGRDGDSALEDTPRRRGQAPQSDPPATRTGSMKGRLGLQRYHRRSFAATFSSSHCLM